MACYDFLRLKSLRKLKKKTKQLSQKGDLSMVLLSTLHLLSISATEPVKAGICFSTEAKASVL